MSTPRKPDFKLAVLNKVTNERGNIGAAWKNEDGSISIVLSTKVVITQSKDEIITLFAADTPIPPKGKSNVGPKKDKVERDENGIPF